jgi:hypothetical protein
VTSLTRELKPTSPIGRYLRLRYPNLRDLQRRYQKATVNLALLAPDDGAEVSYGTLGTAFDWRLRFLLDPTPDLRLAFHGALSLGKAAVALFGALAAEMGGGRIAIKPRPGPSNHALPAVDEASRAARLNPERLARACYALALFTEVFRAGPLVGSRLRTLSGSTMAVDELLALATDAEVADLLALTDAARRVLLPALIARGGPVHVGPTFTGSADIPADADLIAGGLLVELKATLGDRRPDGTRRCTLAQQTMHELLGYLLLDYDNDYHLDALGVYSARYAYLAVWPLAELLEELAGSPVDLTVARAEFRTIVQAMNRSGRSQA